MSNRPSKCLQVSELECENEIIYILDHGKFVLNGAVYMTFIYVWSLLGFVLPVLMLIYCNVHMVRALRESYRLRRLYAVSARVATSCGSRVTPTLVAIVCIYLLVCMYLVLITPSELIQFFYYVVRRESAELFSTAIVATNVLLTMNFAFNFLLYCIVNVHFRATLRQLVCCALRQRWERRAAGARRRGGSFDERPFSASFRRQPRAGPSVYLHVSPSSVASHRRPHRQQPMTNRRSITTLTFPN